MNPPESMNTPSETTVNQFFARVVSNQPVSPRAYRLDLAVSAPGPIWIRPGQFFMIRTSTGFDPLLRRPFSLLTFDPRGQKDHWSLSILYQAVGRGTQRMTSWNKDQLVDMLGPLGKGFDIPEGVRCVVLIAGGMGIASLFGLATWILREKDEIDMRIGIGAKSQKDILMTQELRAMGARVEVTTEDGSMGERGLVTDWFAQQIPMLTRKQCAAVYACGPLAMLAKVSAMTEGVSVFSQISLEARMACGVGACLGCAVKTRARGYQLVCQSGPVFNAKEIDWQNTRRLL